MNKNNIENIFQFVRFNQIEDIKRQVNASNVNQVVDEDLQNLLHQAISSDSIDILRYLLTINIDVNAQDNEGKTPLHYCGLYSNLNATKALLENSSIEVNKRDVHGNNPLWTAVFNARGYYDIVRILRSNGANPHSKNLSDRSPLDFAKQIEDSELVKILEFIV